MCENVQAALRTAAVVHLAQRLALHRSTEMPMKRAITKATTSFLRIFFHPPTTSSSRPSSASHAISVFNGCCWVSPPQSYPILPSPCERQTPSRQAGKSSHNSTQHLIETLRLKVRLNNTNPTYLNELWFTSITLFKPFLMLKSSRNTQRPVISQHQNNLMNTQRLC